MCVSPSNAPEVLIARFSDAILEHGLVDLCLDNPIQQGVGHRTNAHDQRLPGRGIDIVEVLTSAQAQHTKISISNKDHLKTLSSLPGVGRFPTPQDYM